MRSWSGTILPEADTSRPTSDETCERPRDTPCGRFAPAPLAPPRAQLPSALVLLRQGPRQPPPRHPGHSSPGIAQLKGVLRPETAPAIAEGRPGQIRGRRQVHAPSEAAGPLVSLSPLSPTWRLLCHSSCPTPNQGGAG